MAATNSWSEERPQTNAVHATHYRTLANTVRQVVDGYLNEDDQSSPDLYVLVLSHVELALVSYVLRRTHHNQSKTAKILGLNRGTLRKKMDKYRL